MKPSSNKIIASMLIMLMLMTPLTGMAMQWMSQPAPSGHCHDMQKPHKAPGHTLQHSCHMNVDDQELCNNLQHCSNSIVSILVDFKLSLNGENNTQLFSQQPTVQFTQIPSDLFRPPRT